VQCHRLVVVVLIKDHEVPFAEYTIGIGKGTGQHQCGLGAVVAVGRGPSTRAQLLQGNSLIPGKAVAQVIDADIGQLALPGQLLQVTAKQPFKRGIMGGLFRLRLTGRRFAVNLRNNIVEKIVGDGWPVGCGRA